MNPSNSTNTLGLSNRLRLSFKIPFLVCQILLACTLISRAANVTMTASDAGGTSSFAAAGHWSNGAAPVAGNSYDTGNFILRTTNDITSGNNYIFFGGSLSVDAGGRFLGKFGNNGAANNVSDTITVTNLILNGGYMDSAGGSASVDNEFMIVAGNITVNAASGLGALGETTSAFETLNINAPISGSAALAVSGSTINAGADTGLVQLSAANPYSGTITVSNGVIANSANGLLQLNNPNALSNATLNVNSVLANPVSFASGIGTFNVGALTGKASLALTDTAGSAVTLSVGGNNSSGIYTGVLTDGGSGGGLIKVGSGTLTIAATNLYSGATTVSGGTLSLGGAGSISNSSSITVSSGAIFGVPSNFILSANQSLLGSGTINGSVNAASGSSIYAGLDGTYGTNTFTTNVTFAFGAQAYFDVGTVYDGSNDLMVVGENLALNSTIFVLTAPSSSANLDTTADYTLIKVEGSISGSVASTPIWNTPPLNAANYSVVQSGNLIKLHYTASTPPTGAGSVNPSTVTRNQTAVVSVTVTSSSHPISTVTLDASSVGGSTSLPLIAAGGGVYTNTIAVGAVVAPGNQPLVATITDNSGLSGTTPSFTLTVTASTEVWSGSGANNNWSSNPNWTGGAAPGFVGDAVTFAGTTRLAPNMDVNYSVTDLTFDGTAGNFVIGTTGNGLILTGDGVNNNSANTETLNVPITTAAAETFNASSGNLIMGQAITNGGYLVTVAGSYNATVNGGITGSGGLELDSSGILILNGTNSFIGGIAINSGTLQIAGTGLLGGGDYGGDITNLSVFEYSSASAQTLSGVISFNGLIKDGSGTLTLTGDNTYDGDTIISNGVLQIGGAGLLQGGTYNGNIVDNGTFEFSSSSAQNLSGAFSGTGSLVKDGTGTLTNNASISHSGATIVTGGILVYNPNTVAYPTINAILVSNAVVSINAGTGSSLAVGNLTLNNNSVVNLNYDFSGGNPTAAAIGTLTNFSTPGSNIYVEISGEGPEVGQFPLISHTGTLLPNINNFILSALPPGVTANLVNNTGNESIDLHVTAVLATTWIPLTASDSAGTSSFNAAGHWSNGSAPAESSGYFTEAFLLRSPADTNAYTFGGAALSVDAGGRFLMKGTNAQVMIVNNLYMNGGLVDYANVNSDNFTETIEGSISLSSGVTSYIGALGLTTTTAETLFVTAPISGEGNLEIGGTNINSGTDIGTVVLAGTNDYTGTTTVATGYLLVNGSVANSPVTVNSNASLGGTGSIGDNVTVQTGGQVAPGIPSVGALTPTLGTLTAGNVTLAGTALIKLNRTAAPTSDKLSATSIVVSPGATLTVTNIGSTNLVAGDTFTLFSTRVSGSFSTIILPALPGTNVYWANNLAMNGTIAVMTALTVNTNSTNITATVSGSTLTLAWPADHLHWHLQVQTNSLSSGLGTNWYTIPGSDGVIATNITMNPTSGAVFYRMVYP